MPEFEAVLVSRISKHDGYNERMGRHYQILAEADFPNLDADVKVLLPASFYPGDGSTVMGPAAIGIYNPNGADRFPMRIRSTKRSQEHRLKIEVTSNLVNTVVSDDDYLVKVSSNSIQEKLLFTNWSDNTTYLSAPEVLEMVEHVYHHTRHLDRPESECYDPTTRNPYRGRRS